MILQFLPKNDHKCRKMYAIYTISTKYFIECGFNLVQVATKVGKNLKKKNKERVTLLHLFE